MDIAEEREDQYGDANQSLDIASEIYRAMFGEEMEPERIAKVMIALKWARQRKKKKKDNLLDSINYTAILAYYL